MERGPLPEFFFMMRWPILVFYILGVFIFAHLNEKYYQEGQARERKKYGCAKTGCECNCTKPCGKSPKTLKIA